MMDLSKLEVFVRVATLGSLTRAAVMLDTTSSALSRQMAVLEKECGGRLFHRTGRGVSLTELGKRILPRVQSVLAETQELAREIEGNAGAPSGDVRLGVLAAPAATLVPPLFQQLKAQYPAVRLHVFEGSSGQIDEWIANGHVDIALVARQGDKFPPNEFPLATSHSCLIGPPNDRLTANETIPFDALHALPLVLPGLPNGMRRLVEATMKQKNLALNVVMEADSLMVQVAMVTNRCGYAILPRHSVNDSLLSGLLSASRIENPRITRTVTLTSTTQKPSTLAAREVMRMIRGIAGTLTNKPDGVWSRVEV